MKAKNELEFEPFKIKMVEPIYLSTRKQRLRWLKDAHYNLFNLTTDKITIDLLTDSGTSAMSQNQWSKIMLADEAYAGALSFLRFEETVKKITGYKFVVPTHQGRAAEHLLFSVMLKKGDIVPNNTHFDTTEANIRAVGAQPINLPCKESNDITSDFPFKGNMDIKALKKLLDNQRDKIPLIMVTATNNSCGGQPISLDNLKAVSELARSYKIPLFIDACRYAENAFLIKERDKKYAKKSISEIASEMFALCDGCTMSAKKDGLANIGGFIAFNDEGLYQKIKEKMVIIEGFPTYGGLSGRDLEAVAQGLVEAQNEDYLAWRVGQVKYLVQKLRDKKIPVFYPHGGHAVFLDAKSFLPHVPQCEFPGHSIALALYVEGGIRSCEIGSVMFAQKDPNTKQWSYPTRELVRLAIPRRVYTNSHLDYVAKIIEEVFANRSKIGGVKFTYEPPALRHFLAHFAPIGGWLK